jgi:hypothetical protein
MEFLIRGEGVMSMASQFLTQICLVNLNHRQKHKKIDLTLITDIMSLNID